MHMCLEKKVVKGRVFGREWDVAAKARLLLDDEIFDDPVMRNHYASLLAEYEKLSRQGMRLVRMGDRMQGILNDLNLELQISEQKYRGIFENVVEGIFRCDLSGILVEVNPAMAAMLGYETAGCMLDGVHSVLELFCNREELNRYVDMLSRKSAVKRFQAEMRHCDGSSIWVEISAGLLCGDHQDNDCCTGVVGVIVDISEHKRMMEEMCRLARTDSLTGLWNRGYFVELSRRELARCRRNGCPLSMLIIDVDHFKNINDTFGHDIGDRALVTLSGTLQESIREVDILARFGGEEFVVLLPDVCTDGACRAADRIRELVKATPVDTGCRKVNMTVSIGATSLGNGTTDLDGLLKDADVALYRAKSTGRDRVEIHQGP